MDIPGITVALSKPIMLASGEAVAEIVLREPTAQDLRQMPLKAELQVGDMLDLAADVAGLPRSAMDGLCAKDVFAVVTAVGKSMGGGVGGMPS